MAAVLRVLADVGPEPQISRCLEGGLSEHAAAAVISPGPPASGIIVARNRRLQLNDPIG